MLSAVREIPTFENMSQEEMQELMDAIWSLDEINEFIQDQPVWGSATTKTGTGSELTKQKPAPVLNNRGAQVSSQLRQEPNDTVVRAEARSPEPGKRLTPEEKKFKTLTTAAGKVGRQIGAIRNTIMSNVFGELFSFDINDTLVTPLFPDYIGEPEKNRLSVVFSHFFAAFLQNGKGRYWLQTADVNLISIIEELEKILSNMRDRIQREGDLPSLGLTKAIDLLDSKKRELSTQIRRLKKEARIGTPNLPDEKIPAIYEELIKRLKAKGEERVIPKLKKDRTEIKETDMDLTDLSPISGARFLLSQYRKPSVTGKLVMGQETEDKLTREQQRLWDQVRVILALNNRYLETGENTLRLHAVIDKRWKKLTAEQQVERHNERVRGDFKTIEMTIAELNILEDHQAKTMDFDFSQTTFEELLNKTKLIHDAITKRKKLMEDLDKALVGVNGELDRFENLANPLPAEEVTAPNKSVPQSDKGNAGRSEARNLENSSVIPAKAGIQLDPHFRGDDTNFRAEVRGEIIDAKTILDDFRNLSGAENILYSGRRIVIVGPDGEPFGYRDYPELGQERLINQDGLPDETVKYVLFYTDTEKYSQAFSRLISNIYGGKTIIVQMDEVRFKTDGSPENPDLWGKVKEEIKRIGEENEMSMAFDLDSQPLSPMARRVLEISKGAMFSISVSGIGWKARDIPRPQLQPVTKSVKEQRPLSVAGRAEARNLELKKGTGIVQQSKQLPVPFFDLAEMVWPTQTARVDSVNLAKQLQDARTSGLMAMDINEMIQEWINQALDEAEKQANAAVPSLTGRLLNLKPQDVTEESVTKMIEEEYARQNIPVGLVRPALRPQMSKIMRILRPVPFPEVPGSDFQKPEPGTSGNGTGVEALQADLARMTTESVRHAREMIKAMIGIDHPVKIQINMLDELKGLEGAELSENIRRLAEFARNFAVLNPNIQFEFVSAGTQGLKIDSTIRREIGKLQKQGVIRNGQFTFPSVPSANYDAVITGNTVAARPEKAITLATTLADGKTRLRFGTSGVHLGGLLAAAVVLLSKQEIAGLRKLDDQAFHAENAQTFNILAETLNWVLAQAAEEAMKRAA